MDESVRISFDEWRFKSPFKLKEMRLECSQLVNSGRDTEFLSDKNSENDIKLKGITNTSQVGTPCYTINSDDENQQDSPTQSGFEVASINKQLVCMCVC